MEIDINMRSINTMAATYSDGPQIVRQEMTRGVTRAVIAIEGDAKRLAPVDRGQLRRSITHEVTASAGGVVGRAGTNLNYAEPVEKGRSPGSQPPSAPLEAWALRHGFPPGYGYVIASYIRYTGDQGQALPEARV